MQHKFLSDMLLFIVQITATGTFIIAGEITLYDLDNEVKEERYRFLPFSAF